MTSAIEKEMLPKAGINLGWYEVLAHLRQAPNEMLRFQDLARIGGTPGRGAARPPNQVGQGRPDPPPLLPERRSRRLRPPDRQGQNRLRKSARDLPTQPGPQPWHSPRAR